MSEMIGDGSSVTTMTWEARAIAAEKTVEILKAKVHALYAGDASSTIQRQLERSNRRQEQAQRRRELTEVRAAELAKYSQSLELEVKERTRDLRRIFDNVTSGFLVVGEDLIVQPGFTNSCRDLLATEEVAGRCLPELLQVISPKDAAHLSAMFQQVFSDALPEELALDMLPHRFVIGDRTIRVETRTIREEGAVVGLLLTILDITSLEQAQRQAFVNQVLIGILKQRSAFQSFASDARQHFASAREAARTNNEIYVRRAIHTVKGNGAAFDLVEVVEAIHEVESRETVGVAEVDIAEASLRRFFVENRAVLEMEYDALEEESYEISGAVVDAIRRAAQGEDPSAIERWTSTVVLKRAEHLAGPIGHYVERLAERLEKQVDFRIVGGQVMIDARSTRPVFQNLAHVLRNAVDHGIESAEERGDKPARGRIEIRVEETEAAWTIAIADDGRGINPDHVADLAVMKGFASAADVAAMTPSAKAELIFLDGFSTHDVATDVSGRGVGMSSVKAAVEDLGGSIRIQSDLGRGTQVTLLVPKPAGLLAPAKLAA